MVFKSKFADVVPDAKYQDLVSNFFWSQLNKFKKNVLFVDYETQRHWTGAQIKSLATRLARHLIRNGMEANDDCVMFYKHCDYIQLVALGVLFAGGSVCAGYDLDPEQEHAYMLAVVKPKFVFVGHELVDEMLRLRSEGHHNYTIVIMNDDNDEDSLDEHKFRALTQNNNLVNKGDQSKQQVAVVLGLHHDLLSFMDSRFGADQKIAADTPLPVQVDPQRPAFILLTSGSTGHPKPVSRSQRNSLYVCHSLVGTEELWDLNQSSTVAAHLALDHGTGIFLLKQCLMHGYKSIIINGYQLESMLAAIRKHQITDLVLGSALVHNMLNSREVNEALSTGAAANNGLGSLRNLLPVGSSIASQSLVSQFMNKLPNCSVRQAFGMSETGFLCVVPRELALRQHNIDQRIVGFILPNIEMKLLNREQGVAPQTATKQAEQEITKLDQTGELYVRGPTVSPGYCGDQFRVQTGACFLPDGFYKSNDICSLGSDGMLRIHGRYSDVLCLGDGWKILPSEIELVIMEHPLVKEAAVVGVPNPKLPTCHAPRAYIVPRDGVEIDDDDDEVDGLFVVQNGSLNGHSKQNGTNNNNNNNQRLNHDRNTKCNGAQHKTISKRLIFKFVAERVSEPKYLVGGIKFMNELPRISIGKVDKRSLKKADGF